MVRRLALLVAALSWVVVALACGQATPTIAPQPPSPPAPQSSPPVPASRFLSISASPRLIPTPTALDWIEAVGLAYDAGSRGAFASWRWSDLEPSPGNFNLKAPTDDLDFLGRSQGLTMLVGIQVLNTTTRELPPDLAQTPFDSPEMSQRFRRLIDALVPLLDEHVRYMSIGNEVDVYLSAHPEEWTAYQAFLEDAAAYVNKVMPWIQIGTTVTFGGATGADRDRAAALTARREILIFTYYPLEADFHVRPPDAPAEDFPTMVRLAGNRPVVLQEVGYPSAERLGSSERAQAEFVEQVFLAWQAESDHIPFLNYFLLHDLTPGMCSDLMDYYGLRQADFEAYLCSLGLRQADGTPKESWQTFVDAARASGLP